MNQIILIYLLCLAHRMRRLQVDETPLALCLHWTQTGGHDRLDRYHFVLQENDPGEITVCIVNAQHA